MRLSLVCPLSDRCVCLSLGTALLAADYILIVAFYLLLAFTGIFAFPSLYDLYTLNFVPCDEGHAIGWFEVCHNIENIDFGSLYLLKMPESAKYCICS